MAELPEKPQLFCALIVRMPQAILAEHSALPAGNLCDPTLRLLGQVHGVEEKSYACGDYGLHCLYNGTMGVWYACWAQKALRKEAAYDFLRALHDEFALQYTPEQAGAAGHQGMQQDFVPHLRRVMEGRNAAGADRVLMMHAQVQDINNDIRESITKLLERQESIEQLVNRSESLSRSSLLFNREARTTADNVRWRNLKVKLCLAMSVALAVLVFLFASCGIRFDKC